MYRVDMHVHTTYSRADGLSTPEEVIRFAERRGMDGIAITDHDTMEGYYASLDVKTRLAVIPGCEISSRDGHILAYNIKEAVPASLTARETIERIHDMGGIAVASHPLDLRRHGVGMASFSLPFDAIEARNGHDLLHNGDAERLAADNGYPIIAGSDAHMAKEVGSCYTFFSNIDDFVKEIAAATTRIGGRHVSWLVMIEHGLRILKRKL